MIEAERLFEPEACTDTGKQTAETRKLHNSNSLLILVFGISCMNNYSKASEAFP